MPTFSQLPSGKWRAQVRRAGIYRNATFPTKREAQAWAMLRRYTSIRPEDVHAVVCPAPAPTKKARKAKASSEGKA